MENVDYWFPIDSSENDPFQLTHMKWWHGEVMDVI